MRALGYHCVHFNGSEESGGNYLRCARSRPVERADAYIDISFEDVVVYKIEAMEATLRCGRTRGLMALVAGLSYPGTKVVVSRSEGAATFTIEVWATTPTAAMQAPATTPPPVTATTQFIYVDLDIDHNAATGASGFEYQLIAHGNGWDSRVWDGTRWRPTPLTPVTASNGLGVYTWTIARSDVGNPTSFTFHIRSSEIVSRSDGGSTTTVGPDDAPDSGTWVYELVPRQAPPPPTTTAPPPAPRPVIGAPATTPTRASVGKRLTMTFRVTRGDTGAPLTKGAMICDPSIGGRILKHAESFSNGTARLSFTLPRASKGKLLRVKLTIRSGTQSATRVVTIRIR